MAQQLANGVVGKLSCWLRNIKNEVGVIETDARSATIFKELG